jgi:hypothetical protein
VRACACGRDRDAAAAKWRRGRQRQCRRHVAPHLDFLQLGR